MATWPTITDDDGSNTTGTVINNTNVFTPIQNYIGGAWSNTAFNAGHYTGSGTITWTVASGDVEVNRWVQTGRTVYWTLRVITSTVSGTGTELRVALPNGFTSAHTTQCRAGYVLDNGTSRDCTVTISQSATYAAVTIDSGANWAAATNTTYVLFQIFFEATA